MGIKVFRCKCGEARVVNNDILIVQCVHCGEYMHESGKRLCNIVEVKNVIGGV